MEYSLFHQKKHQMRWAQDLTAMYSCFGLVRPHQHGIAKSWAHDLAMPCWWGLTRPKQLYMAVKSWAHLIWCFFGGKGSIPSTVVAVRRFIVVYVTIFHFFTLWYLPTEAHLIKIIPLFWSHKSSWMLLNLNTYVESKIIYFNSIILFLLSEIYLITYHVLLFIISLS